VVKASPEDDASPVVKVNLDDKASPVVKVSRENKASSVVKVNLEDKASPVAVLMAKSRRPIPVVFDCNIIQFKQARSNPTFKRQRQS
jgi:hypothetical protein